MATAECLAGLRDDAGGAGWDAILLVVFAGGPGEVGSEWIADGVTIRAKTESFALITQKQGEAGDKGIGGEWLIQEGEGLGEWSGGEDLVKGLAV